jgi:predicted transcriptional regulator
MSVKFGTQSISLKALIHPHWLTTEMRVSINESKVQQYAEEKKEGTDFPDPVVFFDKDERHYVGDGFHRILAEKRNGKKSVTVELRKGGRTDAILHNIEANKKQKGLPFSRGDLRRAILELLTNPDISGWSQTKVAETVGCSTAYVSWLISSENIERTGTIVDKSGQTRPASLQRDSAEGCEARRSRVALLIQKGLSSQEIAEKIGVSKNTVQNDRNFLRSSAGCLIECPHCHGSGYISNVKTA